MLRVKATEGSRQTWTYFRGADGTGRGVGWTGGEEGTRREAGSERKRAL